MKMFAMLCRDSTSWRVGDAMEDGAICDSCFPHWMHPPDVDKELFVDCTGIEGLACHICEAQVPQVDIEEHRNKLFRSIPLVTPDDELGTSNFFRIILAKRALSVYEEADVDQYASITDLLTDIAHLCCFFGIDFDRAVESAKGGFKEEFIPQGRAEIKAPSPVKPELEKEIDPPVIKLSQKDEVEAL